MSGSTRVAVVMACHDRRAKTLRCLEGLFAQQSDAISIAVHLLDDASGDGTGTAVARAFPQVTLLAGDGRRFWGGGMFDAMRSAGTSGYDFMLWLNDDVTLVGDALSLLLADYAEAHRRAPHSEHIIVGACIDPDTGRPRYSGLRRVSGWHPARLELVAPTSAGLSPCDTMNGNCVLVPIAAVRRIGFVDPGFVQQFGDIDYGYRATRRGMALWVARQPIGCCPVSKRPTPWLDANLSLRQRWRLLDTPMAYPRRPWLRFMWRHGGVPGLAALVLNYMRLLFLRRAARPTSR